MVHPVPFTKLYLLLLVALLCQLIVSHAQVLTGFTLIKPPNTSLGPVPLTINLTDVGTSLNIKAETSGMNIAKVVFWFDGSPVSTEIVEPYALGKNKKNSYFSFPRLSTIGTHTVVAKAYNSQRKLIEQKAVTFTVVESTPPSPQATPITVPASTPHAIPITLPASTPVFTPQVTLITVPAPSPQATPIAEPAQTPNATPITVSAPSPRKCIRCLSRFCDGSCLG